MNYGNVQEPDWPRWGSHDPELAVQRRTEIKVGAVVFTHNVNRRVYFGGTRGNERISERHHFQPEMIIGETRVSWLIGPEWRPTKYPKRDPSGLYGLADIEDRLWVESYAYRLSDAVRRCGDAEKMRQIARMVGFEP